MSSRRLKHGKGHSFKPGDRVRLKASFLQSTGQYTGHDAHAKWTVVAVDGDMISVDEPMADLSYWTPSEIEQMTRTWHGRRFVPRRILAANLTHAGKPDYSGL